MERKEIVKKFLKEKRWEELNLIAAIYYGSSQTGIYHKNSDIDVLLITKEGPAYYGNLYLHDIQIDYEIKSLSFIEQECFQAFKNQDMTLLAILQNGEILLNKGKIVEKLQKLILKRFRAKLPTYPISEKEKKEITIHFQELCQFKNQNANTFWILYYNVLNQIRKVLQMQNGESKIPEEKMANLFQNREYAKQYFCATLPSETITDELLEWLQEEEKENAIKHIQSYAQLIPLELSEKKWKTSHFPYQYEKYSIVPKMEQLKGKAAQLSSKYQRVKYALQEDKMDAIFLYAILIEELRKLYEKQCGVMSDSIANTIKNYQILTRKKQNRLDSDFINSYLTAHQVKTNQERETILEQLYKIVLENIDLEDEYLLKRTSR
ncbi:MAG: hypothetical protein HFH86_00145 [Bacilli bacterium]|nr:hypothetical protein [Bacilli bacterium]